MQSSARCHSSGHSSLIRDRKARIIQSLAELGRFSRPQLVHSPARGCAAFPATTSRFRPCRPCQIVPSQCCLHQHLHRHQGIAQFVGHAGSQLKSVWPPHGLDSQYFERNPRCPSLAISQRRWSSTCCTPSTWFKAATRRGRVDSAVNWPMKTW